MKFLCKLEIIHVAGTRMIDQRTDGLSRGDMYEGVMSGSSMLSFIPLHLSASERSPQVIDWVKSWVSDEGKKTVEVLSPEGWFTRGHDHHGAGRRNLDGYWMPEYKARILFGSPHLGSPDLRLSNFAKPE